MIDEIRKFWLNLASVFFNFGVTVSDNLLDYTVTIGLAWYFAGWLIALVNDIDRVQLPAIKVWASRKVLPTAHRLLFKRLMPELRQSPKVHRLCATHEAGHVLAALLICPDWVESVRADGYNWVDNTGGSTWTKSPDSPLIEQDYLNLIAIFYGGLVAEKLVLGTHSDGCSGDLKLATRFADQAYNLFAGGHRATPIDYAQLRELGHVSDQIDHQRMAAVIQLLKYGHQRAINILSEERALLDAITEALLEKGQLDREELLALHAIHASKKA